MYTPEVNSYASSASAVPLTVRHVRVDPVAAFQSALPPTTAEFAEVDRGRDGAPDPVAFPDTPTPPWLRQTVTPKPPRFDVGDVVVETVIPVAVAPTAPVHT